MEIEMIRRQIRERKKNALTKNDKVISNINPRLYKIVTKLMILSIMFLGALIYTKYSEDNKQLLYDVLLKDNISFAVINNLYDEYLGGILPFKDMIKNNKPVFKEKLVYSETNIYKDGVALSVEDSYLVPAINSGIVVFVGEKEGYGKTVIVQQVNGVDVWYSNIDNLSIKIYDYVEGGNFLGEAIGNKLYLVFKKEGKVLDYKEYI